MKESYFKIKAMFGLLLFLYFPIGLLVDFNQYTNSMMILLLALFAATFGTLLILPFMRAFFNLSWKKAILGSRRIK